MMLSNADIKEFMHQRKLRIDPLEPGQIGPASVDLTLGNRFWFFKKKYVGEKVDLSKVGFREATKAVKADLCVLGPGEMCLGITKEKLTLSPELMGRLEGRSRYARMGLGVHITSAVVQPGSSNHQVLEIVNSAPFTMVLHAGMRISQVVFQQVRTPSTKPYAKYGKIARNQ